MATFVFRGTDQLFLQRPCLHNTSSLPTISDLQYTLITTTFRLVPWLVTVRAPIHPPQYHQRRATAPRETLVSRLLVLASVFMVSNSYALRFRRLPVFLFVSLFIHDGNVGSPCTHYAKQRFVYFLRGSMPGVLSWGEAASIR